MAKKDLISFNELHYLGNVLFK